MYQRTLAKSTRLLIDREPLGNKKMEAIIHPAGPNTGRVFKVGKNTIEARLKYAQAKNGAMLLENQYLSVIHCEHVLGVLEVFEIDNAIIELKQIDSLSYNIMKFFKLNTKTIAFPNFEHREYELCQALLEAGTVEQNSKVNFITISEEMGDDNFKLIPRKGSLTIKVFTNYPNLLDKGEAEYTFDGLEKSKKRYADNISKARPYLNAPGIFNHKVWLEIGKRIAGIFYYPSYGWGHGINESNQFFYPHNIKNIKSDNWNKNEIAEHSLTDRIGEISLLGGRLVDIEIIARRSSHHNTLKFLKYYFPEELI